MFGNLINNALDAVGGFSGLAKSTIAFLQKGVQVYDASKNSITVAGLELTGWESAKIDSVDLTKESLGTSPNEVSLIKQVFIRKLTVSVLPTSPTNKSLERLAQVCMNKNKFFMISVTDNGEWYGDYKAQFANYRNLDMALEAGNVDWEFYIVPLTTRATQ